VEKNRPINLAGWRVYSLVELVRRPTTFDAALLSAPRMEASMDQSGKGSRFRRVLPFALAGVGVYAVVAYGSSMFNSAPTHLVAQRVTPADQMIAAADPVPAAAPVQLPGQSPVTGAVGQVGSVGRDVLPGDAAAVTRNLNNNATTTVIPSSSTQSSSTPATSTSTNPAATPPSGLLSGIPVVSSLPVAGAVNNLPLQNITGSGVLPTSTGSGSGSALKNIAGLGGVQTPMVNGLPLGGGLIP
jgi:hypothetical protein